MNARRVLQGTFWATVFVQTLGAVDLGPNFKGDEKNRRKMPPPKTYVAIVLVWTILGWVAQVSENLARSAAALSGLVLLTSLFVNTTNPDRYTEAGTRLVHFFNYISKNFGPQPLTGGGPASEPFPPEEPTNGGSLV